MWKTAVDLFELSFDNPSRVYAPGQTLSGYAELHLNKSTTVNEIQLEITGIALIRWHETRVINIGKEHYMRVTVPLITRSEKNNKLEAGKYRYPFAINLPTHIPSSYETDVASIWLKGKGTAELRYKATATVSCPWMVKLVNTQMFTVLSIVDLNLLPLNMRTLTPRAMTTSGPLLQKIGVEATLRVNKTCFVPGDILLADIDFVNISRVDTFLKLSLIQICTMKFSDKSNELISEIVSKRLVVEGPADGSVYTGTVHIVSMFVPHNTPPSTLGGGCRIIDVGYQLKLFIKSKWRAAFIPTSVVADVIIGTVPLVQQQDHPRCDSNSQSASNFDYVTSPPCSDGVVSVSEADVTSHEVNYKHAAAASLQQAGRQQF